MTDGTSEGIRSILLYVFHPTFNQFLSVLVNAVEVEVEEEQEDLQISSAVQSLALYVKAVQKDGVYGKGVLPSL